MYKVSIITSNENMHGEYLMQILQLVYHWQQHINLVILQFSSLHYLVVYMYNELLHRVTPPDRTHLNSAMTVRQTPLRCAVTSKV